MGSEGTGVTLPGADLPVVGFESSTMRPDSGNVHAAEFRTSAVGAGCGHDVALRILDRADW